MDDLEIYIFFWIVPYNSNGLISLKYQVFLFMILKKQLLIEIVLRKTPESMLELY